MSAFFRLPPQSNNSLREKNYSINSLLQVLSNVTVMMHGNLFNATVQMGVPRLKVLILIIPTVQWHILNNSE